MNPIVVLSDMHCGSIFGMLPPGFTTAAGNTVSQTPGQAYLWDAWQIATEEIQAIQPVAIVLNGDIIDGRQEAQRGTEMALPIHNDQVRAAEETLRSLKAVTHAKWYAIQGTEYHDGRAGDDMEVLARNLGCTEYRGLGTGVLTREVLDLDVDGVVCNFAHGIGVSAGLYRATAPDREGVWSALAGKEGKAVRADAVLRAHAHYWVHVEHETKHIAIGPCWQLQTRFMRKNGPYRMVPSIGYYTILVDGDAKRDGMDGVTVKKRLFPLPHPEVTRL